MNQDTNVPQTLQIKNRISQTDIPYYTLEYSLKISSAICNNYGKKPTKPLRVAEALNMTLSSGTFRGLCGSSIAYGLTNGGYNASEISVSELGRRINSPTKEGDDKYAMREAFMKPRIIKEFLEQYKNERLPSNDQIAYNVLEEKGVPRERVEKVYKLIISTATSLGMIREIKGSKYIDLDAINIDQTEDLTQIEENDEIPSIENAVSTTQPNILEKEISTQIVPNDNKKVFITHGKNIKFIETIKKLLKFGEMEPIVAEETQTSSIPVPDKILSIMRSCSAAIIHVDGEQKLIDQDAKEYSILNSNVLIEIGAALALYGNKFILLVKDGISLPSNLQGLYEVRYTGEDLDGEVTLKLLEAINDMKKREPFKQS